ncbi:MAG: HPr kinase/phosphorylase [Hyphomicrobiaceae bacterium]
MVAVKSGNISGTTIARQGWAVLIRGKSGLGKSDLALRAICQPIQLPGEACSQPFQLVSDDQTVLTVRDGLLLTSSPGALRDLIEVRGIGIVSAPTVAGSPLALIVDLVEAEIERMPDYPGATDLLLGYPIDVVRVAPFEVSAPLKIALALARSIQHRTKAT